MADAQLSVELTARIDGLRDSFNKAIQETNNLDAATKAKLKSIDKGFADLANGIDSNFTGKVVKSVRTGSNSASQDLAKIAKASAVSGQGIQAGSNKAGQALTDLSRITQDLPYGFIGIQNNLNPMLESFGRLRAETGSTGAALKALLGGLVGPAGLGIALAAVSTGVLLYQQYQQRANKTVKESKEGTDDYVNSLSQLDQVQVKGAQNASRERTELATLYGITQNVTLSTRQRLDAVNELQNKYPEYFKNLKDESILNGDAKDAYDRLSLSILATARARAAQDLITKNSSRQLENEQKITDIRIKQQEAVVKLQKAEANLAKGSVITSGGTAAGTGDANARMTRMVVARNELRDLDKQIYDLATDTGIINERNLRLTESITDQIKQGADLTGKVGAIDTPQRTKDVRTLTDVLKDLNIELIQAANNSTGTFGDVQKDKVNAYQKAIDELIKLGFDPANDAILRLKKSQDGLFAGDLANVPALNTNVISSGVEPIQVAPVLDMKPVILGKSELDKALDDLENKKDQFLSLGSTFGMASSALSDGFAAIGEGLANGGNVIEAFGQVVINAFASFLAELGKQTIAEGLFHIAKGVAYASNPLTLPLAAGEFASGAGLIAAGGLLSIGGGLISGGGNRSNTPQREAPTAFANGGVIYGPTLGLMGEYAGAKNDPEVVAPLSKLKHILGDTDEVGNALPGGRNQPIIIMPNSTIKGKDIVTTYNINSQDARRT